MLINTLIAGCILTFIGIFGVAVFFRIRVLQAYRILVNNRVQFDKSHIFDRKKLEEEILPKYPKQRKEILAFVDGIRLSMTLASVLITVLSLCAAALMFLRY